MHADDRLRAARIDQKSRAAVRAQALEHARSICFACCQPPAATHTAATPRGRPKVLPSAATRAATARCCTALPPRAATPRCHPALPPRAATPRCCTALLHRAAAPCCHPGSCTRPYTRSCTRYCMDHLAEGHRRHI
eukprot:3508386-Pleurochrysis_carterae.AAC.1